MSREDRIQFIYIIIVVLIFPFLTSLTHLVLHFLINETYLEDIIFVFESSPLFNFHINISCDKDSNVIFHEWNGIKKDKKTYIDKINGYKFCYKYISYQKLLYNGQIKKDYQICGKDYPRDCGIIDTLNQHLCIKNDERCPLYDIRIGNLGNNNDYIYNQESNISYNNDNYNVSNKKIIGKLILNDGQPCYRLKEKLWRKFVDQEIAENHLVCELEINGKTTDNRYTKQGVIDYKKLYYDNLSNDDYKILLSKITDDKYVTLYKREFLGIDKTCHDKIKKKYKKLNELQKKEKVCVLVESILIFLFWIFALFNFCNIDTSRGAAYCIIFVIIPFYILLFLAFLICHSYFLGTIIKNDLSYNCSDVITNELLKQENRNTKKTILYTAINLGVDILYICLNIVFILLAIFEDKLRKCIKERNSKKKVGIIKSKNNKSNIQNNKDVINKECSKDITIKKESPTISNEINKPIDNNQSKIMNNLNPLPILRTGAPPPNEQGNASNANIL